MRELCLADSTDVIMTNVVMMATCSFRGEDNITVTAIAVARRSLVSFETFRGGKAFVTSSTYIFMGGPIMILESCFTSESPLTAFTAMLVVVQSLVLERSVSMTVSPMLLDLFCGWKCPVASPAAMAVVLLVMALQCLFMSVVFVAVTAVAMHRRALMIGKGRSRTKDTLSLIHI